MEIECTEEELHAFKTRMTQQKKEIPQKTGDTSFQFEDIEDKTHYRWETYSSNGPQAAAKSSPIHSIMTLRKCVKDRDIVHYKT